MPDCVELISKTLEQSRVNQEMQSLHNQLIACSMNLQTQTMMNAPNLQYASPYTGGWHYPMYSLGSIMSGITGAQMEHKEPESAQKEHHEQLDEIEKKVKDARECVADYYKFRSKIYEIRDITSGQYEDARTKELDRQERVHKKFLHSLRVSGAILTALLALFLLVFFIVSVIDMHIIRAWLSFPWFFVSGTASLWMFAKSSEDEP